MDKSAYVVKSYPNGIDCWEDFQTKSIIAIGWSKLGDVSGKNEAEIRKLLIEKGYTEGKIGMAVSQIYCFSEKIKVSDFIVVPHNQVFIIGKVKKHYEFKEEYFNDGYPHTHYMEWLAKVPLNFASDELSKRLTLPPTIISISAFIEELEQLIEKFGININPKK